jgi:hypothetical protein
MVLRNQDVSQRESDVMVCRNCKMELPVYAKYCPSCGRQVHAPHVHHEVDVTKGPQQEAHARHVDFLFDPVYHEIERRLDEPIVDKPELFDTVRWIEGEALKGESANAEKVSRWLKSLATVAPDILALTTAALLKPDAEVAPAIRRLAQSYP